MLFLSLSAGAQDLPRQCPSAEVRAVQVGSEVVTNAGPASTVSQPAAKGLTVIALGPVLGAMDASEIKTELACTRDGVVLTATVTRSADFNGAVLANVNWRPRVEVGLVLRRPHAIFKTIWRMRLSTGTELRHAQTPPYAGQRYPVVITTRL